MNFFAQKLLKWYKINKRDLPWRTTKDPYKIWLSEIILQQTQVNQGLSYYLKFIEKYPDVKKLANAPEDEVLRLWQGLGYYSRARNLHFAAKYIVKEHNAGFPSDFLSIKKMKGVGDYTAAAVASIAFNLPHAVVDGNVYRVLSRVFGITEPIDSTKGKKYFNELANELLDQSNPSDYNQAIMEFGALYCKPVNPDCANCIFNDKCLAFINHEVQKLPVKSKKTKIRNRYFNYILIQTNDSIFIRKRSDEDIWKGLYEFVLIETDVQTDEYKLIQSKRFKQIFDSFEYEINGTSKLYKHILSHQHIYARFIGVKVSNNYKNASLKKIKMNHLGQFAFPRLIEKHLKEVKILK